MHDVWILIEALALLVVMGLALPGIHVADEAQREAAAEIPSGRRATDAAGARGPAGDLAAAGARSGGMAAGARAAGYSGQPDRELLLLPPPPAMVSRRRPAGPALDGSLRAGRVEQDWPAPRV